MDRLSRAGLNFHWDLSPTSYRTDILAFLDSYRMRFTNHDGRVFLDVPLYALAILSDISVRTSKAGGSLVCDNTPELNHSIQSEFLPLASTDLLVSLVHTGGRHPDEDDPEPDYSRSPFYVEHPLGIHLYLNSPGYSSRKMVFVPGEKYPEQINMLDDLSFTLGARRQ